MSNIIIGILIFIALEIVVLSIYFTGCKHDWETVRVITGRMTYPDKSSRETYSEIQKCTKCKKIIRRDD